jgi:uncharacterized tellurite resistance protein B-like protein
MDNWTSTHDVAYCFLCVSFLADGSIEHGEMDAIRGNVKVLLPNLAPDQFIAAMDAAVRRFVGLGELEARHGQFDESLKGVKAALESADARFSFVKNLAYIARADGRILDTEVELIERAIAVLGMAEQIKLVRADTSLFVERTG